MKKSIIPILASLALLGACKKDLVEKYNQNGQNPDINASVSSMSDLKVPEGFNWATTRVYDLNIVLKTADDKAVTNTLVKFMNDGYENKGATLLKTATDEEGRIQAKLMLPSSMKQLVLNTTYLGLPKDILIDLTNETINLQLGGANSAPINTVPSKMPSTVVLGKSSSNKFNVVPSNRTWNSNGVPNYKEETNDVISQSLLANIASALPEQVVVPSNSPMLSDAAVRVIRVRELADVFVTFVSEGAGYRNVLFYYTYNENNPPASPSAIDKYTVIFPNTSLNGSGGGLATGNKVFLGRFPAGTVIGYGIAADGWKGGSQGFNGVTEGNWLVFADKNLNPESNPNLKQHMVLLNDIANHRFIMGFEDIRRDNQGCDHDFNDVLFYTTSNPVTAINDDNVTPLPQKEDQDKDGVSDNDDDYPTDANKAFNNPTGTGSIAFEDQWPSTGDYDLNDVVMNYIYNVVTNAQNKVVRVEGELTLRATGGAFVNGFGVQFPVERSKVSGVTGANLEAGQSKAVLILFENMRNEMTAWNTVRGATTSQEKTYNIAFNVSNGPSLSTFGLGVYNPFIWNGSMGRGYEIHLVNQLPTDLATTSVFGTNRDGSNLSSGSTYVSKNNRLPWAIHTPANFSYPVEKADINTAYLKFAAWVQSGGSLFTDWYSNGTGYRNNENIY
ncbi:MAG: LruC domain-containing protein [Bacteroidetes bacterium]|nr:LruC domain-containing protein [Bacteroidota bacterium]